MLGGDFTTSSSYVPPGASGGTAAPFQPAEVNLQAGRFEPPAPIAPL